ncbi:MAG: hypothetical protein AB2689_08580 [Candidatus Thiodiazotropha taylori]
MTNLNQIVLNCQLSRHADLKRKLQTLKDAVSFLETTIRESKQAEASHDFHRKLELGARLVKTTCDLFISGVAEKAGVIGVAIGEIYDIAQLTVNAANKNLGVKEAVEYSTQKKIWGIKKHIGRNHKASKFVSRLEILYKLSNDIYAAAKGSNGSSGIRSARVTAENALLHVNNQIRAIDAELIACNYHIA